jgi:5'-nucleotidase
MDGEMENFDLNNGTDLDALEANYVSVVPVKYDLTDYDELEIMKKEWEL